MISNLTVAGGHGDLLGAHGWIILAFSGGLFCCVLSRIDGPAPYAQRFAQYY